MKMPSSYTPRKAALGTMRSALHHRCGRSDRRADRAPRRVGVVDGFCRVSDAMLVGPPDESNDGLVSDGEPRSKRLSMSCAIHAVLGSAPLYGTAIPSVAAMRCATRPGSPNGASSTYHTPSGKRSTIA